MIFAHNHVIGTIAKLRKNIPIRTLAATNKRSKAKKPAILRSLFIVYIITNIQFFKLLTKLFLVQSLLILSLNYE